MASDSSSPKQAALSRLRRLGGSLQFWLWTFIAAYTAVSLAVEENYPFSHFPMYGNPNSRPVDYYFLTDGEGAPLKVVWHSGDTAPRIKKRLNTLTKNYVKEHKLKRESDVPPAEDDRIHREVLEEFIAQADRRGRPMPDHVKLWLALIHQEPDGYREEFACKVDWHRPVPSPAAPAPAAAPLEKPGTGEEPSQPAQSP